MQEVDVLEMFRINFLFEKCNLLSDVVDIRVVERVYLVDQCRSNHIFVVVFHLLEFFQVGLEVVFDGVLHVLH